MAVHGWRSGAAGSWAGSGREGPPSVWPSDPDPSSSWRESFPAHPSPDGSRPARSGREPGGEWCDHLGSDLLQAIARPGAVLGWRRCGCVGQHASRFGDRQRGGGDIPRVGARTCAGEMGRSRGSGGLACRLSRSCARAGVARLRRGRRCSRAGRHAPTSREKTMRGPLATQPREGRRHPDPSARPGAGNRTGPAPPLVQAQVFRRIHSGASGVRPTPAGCASCAAGLPGRASVLR